MITDRSFCAFLILLLLQLQLCEYLLPLQTLDKLRLDSSKAVQASPYFHNVKNFVMMVCTLRRIFISEALCSPV